MFALVAALLFPNNSKAQPCPYPGGSTLCQQFGTAHIQVNIQNPTASNTWLNTSFNGQTILINATFTVNSPFSFINCTTRFGPNGRILVVAGGNFESTDSRYFRSDGNGWPGIRVEGGNTLFVNNQIEDAQNGITIASSAATLTITRNTFNRNRVDILVPNHITANAIIVGNTFDATSPNFLNTRPEAGIQAISSFVSVGLPQPSGILDRNVFRNHQRGAFGTNATMNFRFASFECNSQFGIFSIGGRVDVRGQQSNRNLFSYNNIDVQASGANLLFYDSDFEHCLGTNVLSVTNLNAQLIDFRSFNVFRIDTKLGDANDKTGINLERSRGGAIDAFTNRIETNSFVIDQFLPQNSRQAIRVLGGPGSPDIMKIWGNAVTVGPGGSTENNPNPSSLIEVNVGAAYNFSVWFNHIFTTNADLENHRNRWGFFLHNRVAPSSGHSLLENHVAGTGYDHGMCSFHFVNSGPWLMCKNTADFTLRGFHITGDCATSRFTYNTLGHHARSSIPGATNQTGALQMEMGSKLGPQLCQHNTWGVADYAPDQGAWHKGGDLAASRFDYNPTIPGEEPTPVAPVAGWFFDECTQAPPPQLHCEYGNPPPITLDEFEAKIIQDNQIYNPPSTVLAWEDQKQTMAKLLRYPNLKTGNSLATNFYNIYYNSSAGKFAQFNEMLNNSVLIDSIQLVNLTSIRNQLAYLSSKVDSLDGTISNATAAQSLSSGFFYYRSSLLSPIGQLLYLQEAVEAQISSARLASLEQCSQYLLTLPQSTTYEWNQAFLNGLEIKKSQGLTLSESDLTTLRIIANQCPELVGNTREQAINLLPVGDAAIFRPDVPNIPGCLGLYGEGEERTSISNHKLDVLISPNPVTEILNVIFDRPFSGTIDVIDMAGKSVLSGRQVKMQNNLELSVENLLPGIYLLSVRTDFGERISLKFAVSK